MVAHDDLALAAQAMLGRQDVSKDLRFVLGSLPEEVTPAAVDAALARAEIDAEAVADIRQRYGRDLSAVVDRIRPVLRILGTPDDGFEAATNDVDRLTEWLSARVTDWDAPDLLFAAHRSVDGDAMGRLAWKALGDVAQLPAWNIALAKLGHETVENRNMPEQAQAHVETATPALRAFARHVAVATGNPSLFRRVERVTQGFSVDADWSAQWWELPFTPVLSSLTAGYRAIAALAPYVSLIEDAETVERLAGRLEEAGITVGPDPYETAEANRRRLDEVLSSMYDLYLAWRGATDPTAQGTDTPEPPGELNLDGSEYLGEWPEAKLMDPIVAA